MFFFRLRNWCERYLERVMKDNWMIDTIGDTIAEHETEMWKIPIKLKEKFSTNSVVGNLFFTEAGKFISHDIIGDGWHITKEQQDEIDYYTNRYKI